MQKLRHFDERIIAKNIIPIVHPSYSSVCFDISSKGHVYSSDYKEEL